MRTFLLIALTALAGCQSQPVEELNYSQQKALAEQIVQRCYAQGVRTGTPEMKMCLEVETAREVAVRKRNAARKNQGVRVTAYCQNFGGNTVCF